MCDFFTIFAPQNTNKKTVYEKTLHHTALPGSLADHTGTDIVRRHIRRKYNNGQSLSGIYGRPYAD